MTKNKIFLLLTFIVFFGIVGGRTGHADTTYKVKNGDTLWEIAKENNLSVEDLLLANNLNSALIFPEQEIKISNKKYRYTVQKGDTLSAIAAAHGIGLTDLKKWNNITDHLIFPGDVLVLHHNKIATASSGSNGWTKTAVPEKKIQPSTQKQSEQATSQTTPTAMSGKEMTVTATAYTAYCNGCSGTTYTGIDLRTNPNQKVIAVDPSVIPLGSRVWVEGYGEAIAGDIGGAIKGNIIDVFLEQKQDALNWGRKTVKIKILE